MYLILTIQALILLEIFLWTQFALKRKKPYKILALIFIAPTLLSIFITTILLLFKPELLGELDFMFLVFIFCGLLMTLMLVLKIQLFIAMYNKINTKNKITEKMKEEGEDISHIDSEHPELSTDREIFIFLGTMPVFLFAGAYFIAKVIQYILFEKF